MWLCEHPWDLSKRQQKAAAERARLAKERADASQAALLERPALERRRKGRAPADTEVTESARACS